jgi:ribose transport system permease protein
LSAESQAASPGRALPFASLRGVGGMRDYGIIVSFVVLVIALSISTDAFLTVTNITNILDQWAAVGIIACGMTLVFIGGGFDLSVAAIFALAGVIGAKVTNSSGAEIGLLAALGAGLLVGLVNGLLVTVGRINPFIATLASSIVLEGVALAITGGELIPVEASDFGTLALHEILGLKLPIWILAAAVVLLGVVLHRTVFGRYVFSVGGNAEAARLSGVSVMKVRLMTYVISGGCAALGGLIVASRVSTGSGSVDLNLTFNAVIAVVLGGTSILGGEGAIWRTVIGISLLAMIGNGFNLLGVAPVYQRICFGGILLVAVAVDAWSRRSTTT